MRLVPIEKFSIISDKDISHLISLLSDNIEAKRHLRIKQNNKKPYEGKIKNNSFNVNRIIYYQNPLLPYITGRLKIKNSEEVEITFTIRIKYLILSFILLWSLCPTLFFVYFSKSTNIDSIIVSILWFCIGYTFMIIPFNIGLKKDKMFFTELLS